ncbi:MAG TPA: peptide ABC transporter substrate-binding protein [Candidatus Acidoferrum sp.]|nr:peptide ABC transporter substrate-binding protein [Candidatus Acidoferrum sp.]
MLFAKLVTLDDRHQHVPDLAQEVPTTSNGGISADGLTITYHLRKNAVWSDGRPVTSADVKYTWQQIMNSANNVVSRHGYDMIRSIDTPDASTVVLHMKQVFPPIIDAFFGESDEPYGILPEHALAHVTNFNTMPFNAEPTVTDGPYRFARWIRGDRIILTANDSYFRGAPKIKELQIKIITDTNTTVAQLRTGESEVANNLTGPSYHELANDSRITRLPVVAPFYDGLMFNLAHTPLNDRTVRVALAYATDRASLDRDNQYGEATVGSGDLSPFYWAYDPAVKAQPYDPARARAMLDADGWKLGPGAVRVKNGQRLSLLFVYAQGSDIARNVVVEVQQMWHAVGVEVQPKTFSYTQLYAVAQDGGIFLGGKFDVGFYAWISGGDPDDSSQWLSTALPPNGNNIDRYVSPQMDAAQHLALSTFNIAERKRAYATIQKLLVNDVPAIFLFYPPQRYAFVPELHNYSPNGVGEAWNAYDWTFSE